MGSGQGWGVGLGGGCQGGWKTENITFCENSKKKFEGGRLVGVGWGSGGRGVGSGVGVGGHRVGGQGGCEQRSKVFVKIQKKKNFEGGVGRGRVGVGGGGGSDQGLGWWRWGSKVWARWVMWGMGDVNQE